MDAQTLSWVVSIIGMSGFILAGRKVWWCWYVNIACQFFWFLYALATGMPAFFVTALFYTVIFIVNAWNWTSEHFKKKSEANQGLYRTKAVPIDARYFEGGIKSADEIIRWLYENNFQAWWKEAAASRLNEHGLYIKEQPETLRILDREGTLDLHPGEYVVLGSSNRIYIFQADAFESAYERVS